MEERKIPMGSQSKPSESSSVHPHDVFSFLWVSIKEGTLRTNVLKLFFSGEVTKSEVSFEQWCYEMKTLRKTYSESASKEGMQMFLRGVVTDTFHNIGADASLDIIIKKFTIIYGGVYSFDLLMVDIYRADQEKEESNRPFANGIAALLSRIREMFLEQISSNKEEKLLTYRLFHGSRKSIKDSVKYCYAELK